MLSSVTLIPYLVTNDVTVVGHMCTFMCTLLFFCRNALLKLVQNNDHNNYVHVGRCSKVAIVWSSQTTRNFNGRPVFGKINSVVAREKTTDNPGKNKMNYVSTD